MSFPAYPNYEDSGIDWLGEIPAGWEPRKFRFLFAESTEKIDDTVVGPMLSVSGYRGIEVKEYEDENQRRSDDDLVGYRIVRPGQLVVNTMWLNYTGLGVSEHEGHVSPAYRSYDISESLDRRFAHYIMRSSIHVEAYTRLLQGIRPNSLQMSRADLMDFPVLVPPSDDQRAIAAFLDRETAKIDAAVAAQERLIALLAEKRAATISHAVTKGLDPDAHMRDSGIEWLGQIPAHWEVRRLSHLAKIISGYPFSASDFGDEGIPVVRMSDFSEGCVRREGCKMIDAKSVPAVSLAQTDDLLLGLSGSISNFAKVSEDDLPIAINQRVAMIRSGIVETENLQWFFQSSAFAHQIGSALPATTIKNISMEQLASCKVPVAPDRECKMITDHLKERSSIYERMISYSRLGITLLLERRAALITAAVTGKIDVRGEVDAQEQEAA